jgi:hypothetical protein
MKLPTVLIRLINSADWTWNVCYAPAITTYEVDKDG